MRLHRLKLADFGAVREADVTFGPGLNVLHGPNDLGKSTLADAIRLVLLLPHGSTHGEPYVPWTGGRNPTVELTFDTGPQRIWRVRKVFGKGTAGSSLLQESKDGRDFDDVARARQVDAELRSLLGWGIPEPGGAGAGKGLPHSFLATVLLSTQGDVTNLLADSLADDGIASGKDRIAAALQAVAQDPLFVRVLGEVQDRRDEAFTDKGARKTARGSVFKVAADRLAEARKARDALTKQVEDSAGVERDLQRLVVDRSAAQEALSVATADHDALAGLAAQSAARTTATATVTAAQAEVARIRKLHQDRADAVARVGALIAGQAADELAVAAAVAEVARAEQALSTAEAVVGGADPELADTVNRQQLALAREQAQARLVDADRQLGALAAATTAVATAIRVRAAASAHQSVVDAAAAAAGQADQALATARHQVERCDAVDRLVAARTAERAVRDAEAVGAEASAIAADADTARSRQAERQARRAAIVVPATSIAAMRSLHLDLAAANGALDVGLVVVVAPDAPGVSLRVARDGGPAEASAPTGPVEVEAGAAIELSVGTAAGPVATVRIRGGRREAQARVAALEARWAVEVAPHLAAAGVTDLDGLEGRITEARELDAAVRAEQIAVTGFEARLAKLVGWQARLSEAQAAHAAAVAAIGPAGAALDPQEVALTPAAAAQRRKSAIAAVDAARTASERANVAVAVARQRADQLDGEVRTADAARDQALQPFGGTPAGLDAARALAEPARSAADRDVAAAAAGIAALDAAARTRRDQADAQVKAAAAAVDTAGAALTRARDALAKRIGDRRFAESEQTRLEALVAAEDLPAAERAVAEASAALGALPVPARTVTAPELTAAAARVARARAALTAVESQLQLTRGRLMQVGGAVANERLAAAEEAFELAERHEKELEVEYDAWRLLLDALTAADAAQASNLGDKLGPTLTRGFSGLTGQRYDRVHLAASLGTDGVAVGGAVRPTGRLSVGTREQLGTLYRVALAELLGSALVLDDQLVQSDAGRMAWFRSLLRAKARSLQIVVLTCRPDDYDLGADPDGDGVDASPIHRVDLTGCVQRHPR